MHEMPTTSEVQLAATEKYFHTKEKQFHSEMRGKEKAGLMI